MIKKKKRKRKSKTNKVKENIKHKIFFYLDMKCPK